MYQKFCRTFFLDACVREFQVLKFRTKFLRKIRHEPFHAVPKKLCLFFLSKFILFLDAAEKYKRIIPLFTLQMLSNHSTAQSEIFANALGNIFRQTISY